MGRCVAKTDHCFCVLYEALLLEEIDRITGMTTLHEIPAGTTMMGYTNAESVEGTEGWVGDIDHQLYWDPSSSDWVLIFSEFGTFYFYTFTDGEGGCGGMQFINYDFGPTSYAIISLGCVNAAGTVIEYEPCPLSLNAMYTQCSSLAP